MSGFPPEGLAEVEGSVHGLCWAGEAGKGGELRTVPWGAIRLCTTTRSSSLQISLGKRLAGSSLRVPEDPSGGDVGAGSFKMGEDLGRKVAKLGLEDSTGGAGLTYLGGLFSGCWRKRNYYWKLENCYTVPKCFVTFLFEIVWKAADIQ